MTYALRGGIDPVPHRARCGISRAGQAPLSRSSDCLIPINLTTMFNYVVWSLTYVLSLKSGSFYCIWLCGLSHLRLQAVPPPPLAAVSSMPRSTCPCYGAGWACGPSRGEVAARCACIGSPRVR
jgi:hypothetical protein